MRKMCSRYSNSNGFTIAEILVAVAIMGFISAVMVSLVTLGLKAQRQTNVDTQAHMIFRNIISLLNGEKSWPVTVAAAGNSSLTCVNATAAPFCGSGASPGTRVMTVSDQDGKAFYTYSPTTGFTNQGVFCTGFNGAVGQGNDMCPLHFDVFWWPTCAGGAASCSDATIHFSVMPIYNPSPKSMIPFNAYNYGTLDYIRGSETSSCTFTLNGQNQLTETCANSVGIFTANASRGELTVAQPTTVGIYAQEWQRGANYLDLDVAPNSVNGSAVTFQSPNPLMFTAQNDYTKPNLYIGTNSYIGMGTTAPQWPLTLYTPGPAVYGASPQMWANGDDHYGGGILIANDGGFFDFNDTFLTYAGSNGLRIAGSNGPASQGKLIVSGVEGIGTITPQYPLHIYTAGNSAIGAFESTTGGNTWIDVIAAGNQAHFGFGANTPGAYLWSSNGHSFLGADAQPTLYTDDANLYVGINTTVPKAALEVVPKTVAVNTIPPAFSGGIHTRDIALDNAVIVGLNGAQTIRIANNLSTSLGDGRFTGSLYAKAFFYNSDERLKTNIADLQDPLERVCSLRGVSFNWKSTGEKEMGFIAQEVQKTEPSLVAQIDPDKKDSLLSVKYGNIVALVVEAIKKIKLMLFAQDARIQKLEAENLDLRARLERLERSLNSPFVKSTSTGTSP